MKSHKCAPEHFNIFNDITLKLENDMVVVFIIWIYDKCMENYIISSI